MWIPQCNVCRKNLGAADQNVATHFCERCKPHAEAWIEALLKIHQEVVAEESRRINKFRDQFLQEVVLPKKQELKSV